MIQMKATLFPKSLVITLVGILCIPAIAYGSFHYAYPSDPYLVYTKHGKLNVEWVKFSEAEGFTEYDGKEKHFDEETLTADILVLRDYKEPQSSTYEHAKVIYSSTILHQTINCRNRTVSVEDLLMFSQNQTKGVLVKDLYDLGWDLGEAKSGTIDEQKVTSFCSFSS